MFTHNRKTIKKSTRKTGEFTDKNRRKDIYNIILYIYTTSDKRKDYTENISQEFEPITKNKKHKPRVSEKDKKKRKTIWKTKTRGT